MQQLSDEDVSTLFAEVYETYGYDFSQYSKASVKRRIQRILVLNRLSYFSQLKYKVINEPEFFRYFLEELTVNVTEMFRDPAFFESLRNVVLPALARKSRIRIWHAGCATGEEVYSMAILLKEAGLLHKSILYATDINPQVLLTAKTGVFALVNMKLNSENYIKAGGTEAFSQYYVSGYDSAKFDPGLSAKMVFSTHNLVSDQSINVFDLIICRNVLIYFESQLQNRVIGLFAKSLEKGDYLALGSKESLEFSTCKPLFKPVDKIGKIWERL